MCAKNTKGGRHGMEPTNHIDDNGYRSCDNCGSNYCFMRDSEQEL